jgi:hypothetical protein
LRVFAGVFGIDERPLAGAGRVSGDDGARTDIAPGEAALWAPGESHESGSDDGMTVCIVEARIDPTMGLRPAPSALADAPRSDGTDD